MQEYPRNIAIVGSALYGGILILGFFILLLFENGASLYTRYTLHTSTFLVFSFLFMPTLLFIGATAPWIGAVYGSTAAEIVLVGVPGGLLVVLAGAWFCLVNDKPVHWSEPYWFEEAADHEYGLHRNSYSGILPQPDLRRGSAYPLRASFTSAPGFSPPLYMAPRPLHYPSAGTGDDGAFGAEPVSGPVHSLRTIDLDAPPPRTWSAAPPDRNSPWRGRRHSPSPISTAWPSSTSMNPSAPSFSPHAWSAAASAATPASAPSPTVLFRPTEAEYEEAERWQKQQYIAAQRLHAMKAMAEGDGRAAAPMSSRSGPVTSLGSLYVNTLPTKTAKAAAPSLLQRPPQPPVRSSEEATALASENNPHARQGGAQAVRTAAPLPLPVAHSSPPIPLQERVSPHAANTNAGSYESATPPRTPRAGPSPLRLAAKPEASPRRDGLTEPQHIYIDVPFASELRD